jgi:hypothetical protein
MKATKKKSVRPHTTSSRDKAPKNKQTHYIENTIVKPAWEQFELLIARMQRQLAPDAEVRQNHRVRGRSGRLRKLDVSITQKVSAYPVFIVFDCKLHKKPVKLKDVAAFAEQRDDVNATLGVMISNSGFDAGAQAIAAKERILLQTHRQANEADWKTLIGEDAWGGIVKLSINNRMSKAKLSEDFEVKVPFNISIFDEQGQEISNLNEIFWAMFYESDPKPDLGEFELHSGYITHPVFIHHSKLDRYFQVQEFIVSGELIAKRYIVNVNLAIGQVLESHESGESVFVEMLSQSFDWQQITDAQEGVILNNEEYKEIITEPRIFQLTEEDRNLRVIFYNSEQVRRASEVLFKTK